MKKLAGRSLVLGVVNQWNLMSLVIAMSWCMCTGKCKL